MSSRQSGRKSATPPPHVSSSMETVTPAPATITPPTTIVQNIAVPNTIVPNIAGSITSVTTADLTAIAAVTTTSVITTIAAVTTTSAVTTTPAVTITADVTTAAAVTTTAIVTTTAVISSPMTTIPVTTTTITPYTFNIPFAVNNTPLNLELTVQITEKTIKPLSKNKKGENLQVSQNDTNNVNDNSGNNVINSIGLQHEQQSSAAPSTGIEEDINPSRSLKKRKLNCKGYSARQSSLEHREKKIRSSSCKNSTHNKYQTSTINAKSIKTYGRKKSCSSTSMPSPGQKSLLTLTAIGSPISDADLSCSDSNAPRIETSDNGFSSITHAETSDASSTITCVEAHVSKPAIKYTVAPSLHRNNRHLLALLNSDTSSNNGTNGAVVKKQ